MPVIKGNEKANKLIGASDVFGVTNSIYGYGGTDTLEGGFHADNFIWGGTGNDIIKGGTRINRLYGEDGDDTLSVFWSDTDSKLYGGAGSDTLIAGGGGNYLDGGTGADVMYGGSGGDTFIVNSGKDIVVDTWTPEFDNQSDPIDTVRASASFALTSDARIELLETTGASSAKAINLTGSAVSQTIKGNAGANVLDGKGGNDTLIGGLGADTLIGGTGTDTASYVLATAGVTLNLAKVSANTGEASGDTFNSIENLTGTRFNDKLYGNALANKLTGGTGDDYLSGSVGKDTLKGDAGNDRLNGGADSDILTGGSGKDTFVFSTTLGTSNVDQITDFNVKDDTIQLENSVFKSLPTVGALTASQFVANKSGIATDKFDRIVYETDTGKVFYDADGSGAGKAIHFASIAAGLAISATDFFII
ncbi:hypothetical protein AX760_13625 [Pararhizobium antarcticum]|uniref:Calcium-binding protein n=2 Tax=Pararhizobium antarcticum TaxID=1798805 RepID=A0A657LX47_9HYPH|nr:hypothetical protein AX760_13625 [Pararhizobium antarcticum]